MKSDTEMIWDVLVHYCYLVDTAQFSKVPDAIFTADAVDEHGFGAIRGREALREMFTGAGAAMEATVHTLSNHTAVIDGDTARSRCYVTAWHWTRTSEDRDPLRPADFVMTGAYADHLQRIDGKWLISHRVCHVMGPMGVCIGSVTPALDDMVHNLAAAGAPADITARRR
ncbi:nuclear transport factor 2 family protein [Mycobacterium arosiense]|uniref:SnoaL-like domain-containing protein n=1 Tax=Mycobacterium arosiense ATCC BAA-1401 = DSM 45069 TaxID=1265311 RepID=A0A1W9ZQG9_MYCAI|nr:nuclear transport factor 2 family protein [Mycobacterium arosiense]ORA19913.1 hypothetical protein BST14_04085 [Mycobacterium arosiense ATCC BAA-1401 = DSM 45069]